MSSYYILGYYTSNTKEDGKYRKIYVKLTNGNSPPGWSIRPGLLRR